MVDETSSLLSNVMPKNFASFTTGIVMLSIVRTGSKCILHKLQKWMQTVLVLKNSKFHFRLPTSATCSDIAEAVSQSILICFD